MSLLDSVGKFFGNFGGALGGLASGAMSYYGQNVANETNRQIAADANLWSAMSAQNQMNFQAGMANTSWQRGVADMRAAGINPILAASQGGAPSPGGSSASAIVGAPQQSEFSGASQAIATALELKRLNAVVDNIKEDTDKKRVEKAYTRQLDYKTKADMSTIENQNKLMRFQLRNMQLALPGLQVESDIDKSRFGEVLRYLNRANPFGHSATSLLRAVK